MKNGYTIFDAHAHVFPNKIAERAAVFLFSMMTCRCSTSAAWNSC